MGSRNSIGGNSTAGFSFYVGAILRFSRFCFEFRTFESVRLMVRVAWHWYIVYAALAVSISQEFFFYLCQAYLMFLFYVSISFIYFQVLSISSVEIRGFKLFWSLEFPVNWGVVLSVGWENGVPSRAYVAPNEPSFAHNSADGHRRTFGSLAKCKSTSNALTSDTEWKRVPCSHTSMCAVVIRKARWQAARDKLVRVPIRKK